MQRAAWATRGPFTSSLEHRATPTISEYNAIVVNITGHNGASAKQMAGTLPIECNRPCE